jgi:RNA polymerase sigma-70 factor (ECF subfamily)
MQALLEHEAALTRLARRLCRNAADADDLVQDTFERALRAWDRYADRGNVKAWLAAILHNRFIDRCRTNRPHVPLPDLPAPDDEPPAWTTVSDDTLAAVLAELDPVFRRVFELRVAGHSYDRIARELGIPKATVGTRLVRARKRLKALLEQRCTMPA